MAETTIIYNGVTIKNVLTDDIDQQVVADSSGVNPIYVRTTVSCTGIVHMVSPGAAPHSIGIAGSLYDSTLANSYNKFIDDLMQPGRNFAMLVGGQFMFDVQPGYVRPGLPIPTESPIRKRDVNHGPIPSVRILGITSANTMKIQFKIVMHLPYADADGQTPGGAISFRFWISEDIDCDDWTTERTYHGTLRVRHLGHNVHTEIRNNFTFPPLVEGFVRKSIGLHQRPNGLELDFTIRDKEVWAVPPYPATKWNGYQTLFTPRPGGFLLSSDVFVTLKADKATPKLGLLALGQKIMDTKLHRLEVANQHQTILRYFSAKDTFEENKIEMHASIDLVGKERMLWNLEKGNFGRPMNVAGMSGASQLSEYIKDRARIVFPTACIKGLFLAALQDPLHVSGFPNDNEDARQVFYDALYCSHIVDEPPPSDYPANVSQEQQSAAYTVYRMQNQTNKQFGTIQLPYGKSSDSSGTATSVLLSMHKPLSNMRVKIDAERLNQWPTLPSPEEYLKLGALYAPLRSKVAASAPITSADSVKTLYHSSCELHFAQDKDATDIPAGLLPYREKTPPGNYQEQNVFVMPSTVFKNTGILFE